jgi:N-methylhydantoinase B
VLVTNDAHHGSMHLNDICLVAPYFDGNDLQGYAAAVAHHVDIGGMAPGGLCVSRDIYQEGVIIPVVKLIHRGQVLDDVLKLILANIRSPRQTGGDIRAQIAAVRRGQQRMAQIIDRFGGATLEQFTEEMIQYTCRWARREISQLPQGTFSAECTLDDDGIDERPIRLALKATVRDGQVAFDLTGSDAQRPGPMNANLTYSYSAATYVVKCLIDPNIPNNDGFYRLITVDAPRGTVVNAVPPAGVVGGNDVAMRLCDLGFRAFAAALPDRVVACSNSIICNSN